MTTTTAATATSVLEAARYYDDALDRLADLLAERLAVRLNGLAPERAEPLVDAAEIARLHGRTRSWVYEPASELGAVRLGSGPRPRLGFSPARVAKQLHKVEKPATTPLPEPPPPRRRRQRASRTATGAAPACALTRDLDRLRPELRGACRPVRKVYMPPPDGDV